MGIREINYFYSNLAKTGRFITGTSNFNKKHFSQEALPNKKGSFSARNMGKNDLFIAATSSVIDLPLVATDKDFRHLCPRCKK